MCQKVWKTHGTSMEKLWKTLENDAVITGRLELKTRMAWEAEVSAQERIWEKYEYYRLQLTQ
jgi:hypothetical protein